MGKSAKFEQSASISGSDKTLVTLWQNGAIMGNYIKSHTINNQLLIPKSLPHIEK